MPLCQRCKKNIHHGLPEQPGRNMLEVKFPKRFEIEHIDPLTVPVQVVTKDNHEFLYSTIGAMPPLSPIWFYGPFAGKEDEQWCLRFEAREYYESMTKGD